MKLEFGMSSMKSKVLQVLELHLETVIHNNLGIPAETHNISDTTVIYGYKRSDNMAHQQANFLLTLTKSTIYKTYRAATDTDGQPPNYYQLLLLCLCYRLFLEMHEYNE
jgi:hypothetical protein